MISISVQFHFNLPASLRGRVSFERLMRLRQQSILVYLKLILKHKEFENMSFTEKLRNLHMFPTVYHMRQSDKRFENKSRKPARI